MGRVAYFMKCVAIGIVAVFFMVGWLNTFISTDPFVGFVGICVMCILYLLIATGDQ